MVNGSSQRLGAIFLALSDPTHRAILERLAQGEASGTELAQPFLISVPAILKHFHMLEHAAPMRSLHQAGRQSLLAATEEVCLS